MNDLDASFTAIPDVHYEIVRLLAKDRDAVVEFKITGTHTGSIEGSSGTIPATNRKVSWDRGRISPNRFQGFDHRGKEILRLTIFAKTIWTCKIARLSFPKNTLPKITFGSAVDLGFRSELLASRAYYRY